MFIFHQKKKKKKLDCLRSSHPIEVDVKSPGEINEIFDAISYSKGAAKHEKLQKKKKKNRCWHLYAGASVIRMLVEFLGSDVFVRGLRAYLQKVFYALFFSFSSNF